MQKRNIILKESKGILPLQQQAEERITGKYHSILRLGMKHPSSLNNWASCQGIAAVLLGRLGTSIPALFNRNNTKEISKTLQFHFHKVTASTGIISSSFPSSFCFWFIFLQTSSGLYSLSNRYLQFIPKNPQGRLFSESATTLEVNTAS